MKVFSFKKLQAKKHTIYTIIAVALSVFIFSGIDIYINKQVAYLLVTILSSFSIYSAIKKASKEFEEIVVQENEIRFYFQNKMKEPLLISKVTISVNVKENIIEFKKKELNELIGYANKNQLIKIIEWEELLKNFV